MMPSGWSVGGSRKTETWAFGFGDLLFSPCHLPVWRETKIVHKVGWNISAPCKPPCILPHWYKHLILEGYTQQNKQD